MCIIMASRRDTYIWMALITALFVTFSNNFTHMLYFALQLLNIKCLIAHYSI
jgi:hypothetical protein